MRIRGVTPGWRVLSPSPLRGFGIGSMTIDSGKLNFLAAFWAKSCKSVQIVALADIFAPRAVRSYNLLARPSLHLYIPVLVRMIIAQERNGQSVVFVLGSDVAFGDFLL